MSRALDASTLPAGAQERAAAIKRRSTPDLARPRLDTELEGQLAAQHQTDAEIYGEMEELTYRLNRVTKRIRNGRANGHSKNGMKGGAR